MEKISAMPDETEQERLEEYLRLASGTALVGGYETVSKLNLLKSPDRVPTSGSRQPPHS